MDIVVIYVEEEVKKKKSRSQKIIDNFLNIINYMDISSNESGEIFTKIRMLRLSRLINATAEERFQTQSGNNLRKK